MIEFALPVMIFFAATLYASVGHGGASGYLAAMALMGVAPDEMKPAALALNILVSAIALFKYSRRGAFSWALLWPLAVLSLPCAFLGGMVQLPPQWYRPLLGCVLLYAASRLWLNASHINSGALRQPSRPALYAIGGVLGFLSGLTGVGGGIFLSPLLLFLRWGEVRMVSGVAAAFILVNSAAGLAGVLTYTPQLSPALPFWALAAVIGGYVGAEFGSRTLARPVLQRLLAVVLIIAAVKMLVT